MVTDLPDRSAPPSDPPAEVGDPNEAMVREMLARVADSWTLLVLDALEGEGAVRFSELRRRVDGISQKMLTKTLRQLERDGLVTRTVYPEVPPRVEYRLTALGSSLGEAVCGIWLWVEGNVDAVRAARRTYDRAARRGGGG
ncbi:MAG: helix-turn-helix transcriptional regulator [Holophagales bacterium]|nr:helix-turn-helix transcriptional regulator [Holophagales bacterium]